jgi:predicted amino acid dehydrogenase
VKSQLQPRPYGFIIHPIDPKRDVARKYPRLARLLNERLINYFSAFFPPVRLGRATGLRSEAHGETCAGWFVACPYTPQRMTQLPTRTVYRKIVQSVALAEHLGAQIVGLGAYTSVVGDAGITISRHVDVPVTSGDSYTVAVAVQAILFAGRRMGINPDQATLAVVGATGAIGAASAALLAPQVKSLILIGRDQGRCQALVEKLAIRNATISTDLAALQKADLVLSASSSPQPVIGPADLAPGSVVCDVARPHDVAIQVADLRPDVLVIDGGLVQVPGDVDYGFDFGFPAGQTYACMAETMALALEGRLECFTLGKDISVEQVREIEDIATQHGFRLGGLRSFDRPLTEDDLDRIEIRVQAARRAETPA